MKASELASSANLGYVGAVRLTGGHEVFRFVRWTRGKVKKGDHERSAPRMITVGRINGSVGNCSVTYRYISPETEMEIVPPSVTLDEFQGQVLMQSSIEGAPIEYAFCGLLAKAGELQDKVSVASATILRRKAVREALLKDIGGICRYVAIAAHAIGYKMSDLPGFHEHARAIRRCFSEYSQSVLRLAIAIGGAASKLPGKYRRVIQNEVPMEDYMAVLLGTVDEMMCLVEELSEVLGSSLDAVIRGEIDRRLIQGAAVLVTEATITGG